MKKIYLITNTVNKKQYVGQTSQTLNTRFAQHSSANSPLGDDIRKIGVEKFAIEIIEECDDDKANERERFFIDKYNCRKPKGYNQQGNATGEKVIPISFRCPPELKSKLEDLAYLSRRDVSSILIEVCSALVDANKERIIKFRQSAGQPLKLPPFVTPTKKKRQLV